MHDNKETVRRFLKSIETGDPEPLGYVKSYIQHNLGIEDGLDGLAKVLKALPRGAARVNTVRLISDGDHVVAHTEYEFFGPKVGFDVFRFEGDKIVEHWDNLAERSSQPNPSGRTQTDGATEVLDVAHTARNKALAAQFVDTVLVKRQFARAAEYIDGDRYIQHNASIGDGLAALASGLEQLAAQGMTITYDKVHKVLGEGSFVLTVSEGKLGSTPTAYYDLFRIEGGRIAEHWDVIQAIPPREQWANGNGKF